MKWEVSGKPYSVDFFGSFEPLEVLYDFDGPRIFTVQSRYDDALLVYQCDEDETASRFIVVPCDAGLLEAALAGRREAKARGLIDVVALDRGTSSRATSGD